MTSLSGLALAAVAAAVSTTSSPEIFRRIERSSGAPRVLYVAAHPDDENTRLLAWLVHHEGARAAYLSLTRGEGGQNLIGAEQAPLLGLIRTQELLAARRIDGAEQFFGQQADFGYSKSHEEALKKWGHEASLGDVVWVIRQFRPDVIVTRFDPDGRETHGHHTASAILALEAFKAAADPAKYPEQLQWVKPWQAKRIMWNRFFFGAPPKPAELDGLLAFDIGGYDAMLGESYPELAARSRSMHKSQGFGAIPVRGETTEYFKLLAGAPATKALLEGVERKLPTWPKKAYAFDNPAASVAALAKLPATPELDAAIADATGLWLDASVSSALHVPGTQSKVTITTISRASAALVVKAIEVVLADGSVQAVAADKALTINKPLVNDHMLTWPKTLQDKSSAQQLVGLPTPPPPARVKWVISVGARTIELWRPIQRTWNDPVAGERHAPISLAPAVTVNPRDKVLVFADAKPKIVPVRIRASREAAQGVLRVAAPAGVTVKPTEQAFSLAKADAEQVVMFEITATQQDGVVRFDCEGPAMALTTIDYPHIPTLNILAPAELKVVRVDLKKGGVRLGYIAGAGDDVPQSLRQVGYDVTALTLDAVEREPLDGYDAIVVGIRAFNTHARLGALLPRLLKYVDNGGTLVEQYNTNSWIGSLETDIGPHPFKISHDRVTEEDAAITMLQPTHQVWTSPNKIGPADFTGWVQERGLYFSDKWDDKYVPLLASHDVGEPDRQGGLLFAKYGKGRFIYTGLAFFRQLPAGVPGAYRLFANLLAKQ